MPSASLSLPAAPTLPLFNPQRTGDTGEERALQSLSGGDCICGRGVGGTQGRMEHCVGAGSKVGARGRAPVTPGPSLSALPQCLGHSPTLASVFCIWSWVYAATQMGQISLWSPGDHSIGPHSLEWPQCWELPSFLCTICTRPQLLSHSRPTQVLLRHWENASDQRPGHECVSG